MSAFFVLMGIMRIISGKIRGKSLLSPLDNETRPTSDKARGAIFNIIEHASWSNGILNSRALDVFAGTGAFGLEALSRGANFAGFIENSNVALKILDANIKNCRMENESKIIRRDCLNLLPNNDQKYDLIFLDPPYHKNFLPKAVLELIAKNYVAEGAILIAEMEKNEVFDISGTEILKEAIYGINKFIFFALSK